MTLYERYLNGETEQVCNDIVVLGETAFSHVYRDEVDKVLTELFTRVAYNLNIIYAELQRIGYLFKTEFQHNFERPLHAPLPNTDDLLTTLNEAVIPFGYVPLSLQYFYKIVGGVNFVWDYETSDEFMWDMADPIQVASLDATVETVTNKYWPQEMEEKIDEGDALYLELAADDLHKDNVSGGPAYSLEITKDPSVDGLFLNDPHATTFINYLRICFEYCGFPSINRPEHKNDYQSFFDKVKPQLKQI